MQFIPSNISQISTWASNGGICFDIAGALAFWLLWRELKHKEKEKDELKENNKKLQEQNEEIQKMQQFQKELAFAQEVELEMLGLFGQYIDKISSFNENKLRGIQNPEKDNRSMVRLYCNHILEKIQNPIETGIYAKKTTDMQYSILEILKQFLPLYQKLITITTPEIKKIYTSEDSIFKQLFNKCVEFENIAKSEFTNPQ
jgi:hypothetical protein